MIYVIYYKDVMYPVNYDVSCSGNRLLAQMSIYAAAVGAG